MADSLVDPVSVVSSISSLVQNQQQSHNPINPNIIPIISADIQIDNNVVVTTAAAAAAAAAASVAAAVSAAQPQQRSTINDITDEPDIKRKKFENTIQPSTSQLSEKLESRLGGILCCAVCLDLPKMAMYQVGGFFF